MKQDKYSPNFQSGTVGEKSKLSDVISSLNASGLMVCCLVSNSGEFLGILTDSDLRRLMLKSVALDTLAISVCNKNPLTSPDTVERNQLVAVAKENAKREIPLLDSKGRLTDIFILGIAEEKIEISEPAYWKNSTPIEAEMFVLAGGLGTRLRSVVSDRPKPLAEIGRETILDHVIKHAYSCGVRKFYFSVNYKAEMIEEHVCSKYKGKFDYSYVRETKRLGTAGSLSLVKGEVRKPLFVVNADLLTDLDYRALYQSHVEKKSDMTVVVRRHAVKLPFGEVQLEQSRISQIVEKPDKEYLINAGIYLVEPEFLSLFPYNSYFDMPDFISMLLAKGKNIHPFFMHEQWIDIGKPDDYRRARESNFKCAELL